MGECTVGQCPKFMKDIHIVADIAKKQNRFSVVDCGSKDNICNRIPSPEVRSSIGAIYFRGGKIYEFDGNMTQEGLLDFLSADNYKESTVLEEDFEEFVYDALGKNLDWTVKAKKKFEEFSYMIEEKTEESFKKIPMASRWTKTAKVLLVSSFIIPPFVFSFFYIFLCVMVWWSNSRVDAKYAKINKEMIARKKTQ